MDYTRLFKLRMFLHNNNLKKESIDVYNIVKFADSVGSMVKTLGYPIEIAKIIQENVGKNSFIIAKWLKEINTQSSKYERPDDWIDRLGKAGTFTSDGSVLKWFKILRAARTKDINAFKEEMSKANIYVDDKINLNEYELLALDEIKNEILNDILFYYPISKDILSGKLKNVAPYKELSFHDAVNKYEEKRIFIDAKPIIEYADGFKWIDVGAKSPLVGKLMHNCGSTGVMSLDVDKTMIVLFNKENNAKIITTYSPNENRLSGYEGMARTYVKEKYHDKILSLAETLGAKLDTESGGTDSKDLKLKYKIMNIAKNINTIYRSNYNDVIISFELKSGEKYYSNGYNVARKEAIDELANEILSFTDEEKKLLHISINYEFNEILNFIFNNNDSQYLPQKNNIKFERVFDFLKAHNSE
jgi:hypothetical protein